MKLGLSNEEAVFLISISCLIIVCILLTLLMKTQLGLVLRSTGDNIPMSEANGVNVDNMKMLGYMISNGLIALCGAMFAQNDGFSDVTSGTGTIVVGLSAVIIAEVLIHELTIGWRLLSIGVGAIVYRLIILNITRFQISIKIWSVSSMRSCSRLSCSLLRRKNVFVFVD